jgi:hypothetical protein
MSEVGRDACRAAANASLSRDKRTLREQCKSVARDPFQPRRSAAFESAPKARIFISYSRKDMAFADRLEAALKARSFEPHLKVRRSKARPEPKATVMGVSITVA